MVVKYRVSGCFLWLGDVWVRKDSVTGWAGPTSDMIDNKTRWSVVVYFDGNAMRMVFSDEQSAWELVNFLQSSLCGENK